IGCMDELFPVWIVHIYMLYLNCHSNIIPETGWKSICQGCRASPYLVLFLRNGNSKFPRTPDSGQPGNF
ncbi:MAG: hypothetical protein KAI29_01610, partial [Cyclobacteriaceae bacterium]|nr:hypothetical protein [Cyclobacteriaceae bacterium]